MSDAPPPSSTPRPRRRSTVLLVVLAVVAIGLGVSSIVRPTDPAQDARLPLRIDLGDEQETEAAVSAGGGTAGGAPSHARQPLSLQLRELAESYVVGTLTLEGLRDRLTDARLAVNVVLINETAQGRVRWLARLGRGLELASLAALLLLAGPLWVRRRRRGTPEANAAAWKSVPFFVVATAALLVVGNLVIALLVGTEKLQVTVAAFGSPAAAGADAALHYLAYGGDADVDRILRLVFDARAAIVQDPFSAFGVAGVLWVAVQGVMQSTLLQWGRHLFTALFHLLDLYGPLLAALTALVAWGMLAPLVRSLVRYPLDAAAGRTVPTLGRFVLDQLVFAWREVRAATWMLGFVLVFTVLAVAAVRVLTGAAVIVLLKTLLAATAAVAAGKALPDGALFCTMLSLLVYVVLAAVVCLVSAALIFGKAYPVMRTRLHDKRRLRSFSAFWGMTRGLITRVVWPTLVASGVVFALYWALLLTVTDPGWRVWLAAPLLGPLTLLLLLAQGVLRRLLRAFRVDPLARTAS